MSYFTLFNLLMLSLVITNLFVVLFYSILSGNLPGTSDLRKRRRSAGKGIRIMILILWCYAVIVKVIVNLYQDLEDYSNVKLMSWGTIGIQSLFLIYLGYATSTTDDMPFILGYGISLIVLMIDSFWVWAHIIYKPPKENNK